MIGKTVSVQPDGRVVDITESCDHPVNREFSNVSKETQTGKRLLTFFQISGRFRMEFSVYMLATMIKCRSRSEH